MGAARCRGVARPDQSLNRAGFVLVFKPVVQTKERGPKGNVDADLVLEAKTEYGNYEKPLIVTETSTPCTRPPTGSRGCGAC